MLHILRFATNAALGFEPVAAPAVPPASGMQKKTGFNGCGKKK
jgi:hypothetical protein